jgi:murein L,D-transpeptidase YcbB/YkuD
MNNLLKILYICFFLTSFSAIEASAETKLNTKKPTGTTPLSLAEQGPPVPEKTEKSEAKKEEEPSKEKTEEKLSEAEEKAEKNIKKESEESPKEIEEKEEKLSDDSKEINEKDSNKSGEAKEEKKEEIETEKSQKIEKNQEEIIKKILGNDEIILAGFKINKKQIAGFYAERNYKPIWFNADGTKNNRGKSYFEALRRSEEFGLVPEFYGYEEIAAQLEDLSKNHLAEADIMLTQSAYKMLNQIKNGGEMYEYSPITTYIRDRKKTPASTIFQNALKSDDLFAYAESLEPKHNQYKLLKAKLLELLTSMDVQEEEKDIPYGKTIELGQKDSRIPAIRKRLGADGPNFILDRRDRDIYDKNLLEKVIEIQEKYGITKDGVIGDRTLAKINLSEKDIRKTIKANMERWRWIPEVTEDEYLEINIPEFAIRGIKDGKEFYKSQVIVGKTTTPTPIMKSVIGEVIFHPFWHVPTSIARKIVIPAIKHDPSLIKKDGFTLLIKDSAGNIVNGNASKINWSTVDEANPGFTLRQNPGPRNALGKIKFNIENPMDIYLHGTADPKLFESTYRGFSSGCVRVENTLDLANYIFRANKDISKETIKEKHEKSGGPKHQSYPLAVKTAIYVLYNTARVNEAGELVVREDLYDWDIETLYMLGGRSRPPKFLKDEADAEAKRAAEEAAKEAKQAEELEKHTKDSQLQEDENEDKDN